MVHRNNPWPPGTPCWADLGADSVEKARAFYSALFGWESEVDPNPQFGGYAMCMLNDRQVAGIGAKPSQEMPSAWTTYLATPDATRTVEKIKEAGGQVMFGPDAIGEHGRIAVAADPTGAVFGLWEAGKHIGAQIANESGAMVWNEQMSRDFESAKKFYEVVFGYSYTDMSSADMKYATVEIGDATAGGIGRLGPETPTEVPAHWMVYFGVEDTDSAVAKVTELGGTVIQPAVDSPYGRMAVVTDDQGATFALITATQPAE